MCKRFIITYRLSVPHFCKQCTFVEIIVAQLPCIWNLPNIHECYMYIRLIWFQNQCYSFYKNLVHWHNIVIPLKYWMEKNFCVSCFPKRANGEQVLKVGWLIFVFHFCCPNREERSNRHFLPKITIKACYILEAITQPWCTTYMPYG